MRALMLMPCRDWHWMVRGQLLNQRGCPPARAPAQQLPFLCPVAEVAYAQCHMWGDGVQLEYLLSARKAAKSDRHPNGMSCTTCPQIEETHPITSLLIPDIVSHHSVADVQQFAWSVYSGTRYENAATGENFKLPELRAALQGNVGKRVRFMLCQSYM